METKKRSSYPCPSCGFYVFEEEPGSFDICPICFWEDDLVDLEAMYEPMGPNKVSLYDAQRNFAAIGATEERFKESVRKPNRDDVRDPKWRPLDKKTDIPKPLPNNSNDSKELYYWNWK